MNNTGWDNRPPGWEEITYGYVHDQLHIITDYSNDNLAQHSNDLTKDDKKRIPDLGEEDAIFVLAGGLNEENRNHQWVIRRLDLAIELYKIKNVPIICLGGGTYHKPSPINQEGFVMHESTVCVQYLISQGIPASSLMREWSSYDTIANAWFALMNYVIPFNYEKIVIITSDFHMDRTREIFEWIWRIAGKDITKIKFLEVDSEGLDREIIEARKIREQESLFKLKEMIHGIDTLRKFADWFYHEHKAYNCHDSLHISKNKMVDEVTKKSY
jgi:vancomycin permeability regulator SanA